MESNACLLSDAWTWFLKIASRWASKNWKKLLRPCSCCRALNWRKQFSFWNERAFCDFTFALGQQRSYWYVSASSDAGIRVIPTTIIISRFDESPLAMHARCFVIVWEGYLVWQRSIDWECHKEDGQWGLAEIISLFRHCVGEVSWRGRYV